MNHPDVPKEPTTPCTPPRSCPLPPISATLGPAPEHFIVEEIPAYPLSDEGEHSFLWIEKVGHNTPDVAKRLSEATSTKERDIGYAGMKDRHAVTRQWFSLIYRGEQDLKKLDLGEGISVLDVRKHNNKLRTGHLIGNRFTITLVGASSADHERAAEIARHIQAHGLANYYGAQRFGHRGKNLNRALSWLDEQAAGGGAASKRELVPAETDSRRPRRPRRGKKGGRFDNKMHPSVIQSEFFNRYLTRRLSLDRTLLHGEVVRLAGTGTHFVVEDLEQELPRRASGDLVPTGSMPGRKTLQPKHEAAALEASIWAEMELEAKHIETLYDHAPGARRDLWVEAEELSCHSLSDQVVISFRLPAGGYATQVIREFNEVDWMNPRGTSKSAPG